MPVAARTALLFGGVLTSLLVALAIAPLPAAASRATATNAWVLDLGETRAVETVTVRWRARTGRRYRVQTSLDGRSFATAARVRPGRSSRARVSLRGRHARFVRLAGGGRRPQRLVVNASRPRPPVPAPTPVPAPKPTPVPVPVPLPLPTPGPTPPLPPPPSSSDWVAPWQAGTLPAPLGPSTGQVRYVATTGSDANPGTLSLPWRSITKALTAAVPGDRILVRGGTYAGTVGAGPSAGASVGPAVYASPKGTAAAPISLEAYPGERPIIGAMVSLPSAQWFRLSGFVIDGSLAPAGAQGVSLGNTSGLVPSHVEISYNEIRNFGPLDDHAQGILHYSGTDTSLVGNRIHHIGRQTFFDHGIYMKAGRRVVVANNVISDITGGYGLHIWGDFDDSWVINNTVYASAASGFTIGGNSDRGYPDRVVTANNIFAGHSGAGDGHQGYAAKEYQPGGGDSTRHNLGWANARTSAWQLSLSGPSDNQTADPRFVNAAARDLRPAAGSPAIDSAESFGLLVDANRAPRAGAPDKGAYETS